jgi:glycosyltransferase involved in cell wall biosynthesis
MIKKILFITPIPKINIKGGIASWTSLLIKYGLPQNFKFRIVDNAVLGKREIFENNQYFLFKETFRNLKIIFNLFIECLFYRPSLIHLNCSLSNRGVIRDFVLLIITKFFLIPIVVHFRGNLPQKWMDNKRIFLPKFCINYLIKNSNLNLVMNQSSFSYANELCKAKFRNKILGSFIEDSIFNIDYKYLNTSKNLNIIFVGAFTKAKGAIEIIKLAKSLIDYKFIIVGKVSNDMNSYLLRPLKNISFLGQINRDKLVELLLKSDVFLFPSHSEGFPNSVLEAMAIGLPVVASRVGAIPEMIEHDSGGYVVNVGEVNKMKEHLKNLSINPKLRKSMGLFNKKKCKENYSYKIVSRKLVDYYNILLRK